MKFIIDEFKFNSDRFSPTAYRKFPNIYMLCAGHERRRLEMART